MAVTDLAGPKCQAAMRTIERNGVNIERHDEEEDDERGEYRGRRRGGFLGGMFGGGEG